MNVKEEMALQRGIIELAHAIGGPGRAEVVRRAMATTPSDVVGNVPGATSTGRIGVLPALAFATQDGATHIVSTEFALKLLSDFYSEWPGGLEEIRSAMSARTQDFKNFHRLLCERFGYTHDEEDWRRDQLSLIEHIANGMGPAAQAAMRTLTQQGYKYHGAQLWEPPIGKSIAPRAEEYPPLAHKEMKDLSSMIYGAPFSDENTREIVEPLITVYEAVRSMGKRPIEITDMPPDYWDAAPVIPERALPPIKSTSPLPAPGVWIEWDGSVLMDGDRVIRKPECPVPRLTMTTVRFRDGSTHGPTEDVQSMRWAWTRPYVAQSDIVAYMIDDFQTPF